MRFLRTSRRVPCSLFLLTAGSVVLLACDDNESRAPISAVWRALPSAATATVLKHDDVFFVNPSVGWFATRTGEIYKTSDGGESWQVQYEGDAYFRSMAFADSLRGWVGNLRGEAGDVLYQTEDGGTTWSVVKLPSGPIGICGIWVVDHTTVYAVGRVRGPAFVLKSSDGGKSWSAIDMSPYADELIDIYFWTPEEGIVVGSTASTALILETRDGGGTWERRYVGSRTGEDAWKISFPSRTVGYVSIEAWGAEEYFLKTTDGGTTWEDKLFWSGEIPYGAQGIGFVTPTRGWMGSYIPNNPTLKTEDGGETWQDAGFGKSVNRFRFLNDTLGYASGQTIYQFSVRRDVLAARR